MPNLNLAAFRLTVSTLLSKPTALLPHLTIPTLLDLPLPLEDALHSSTSPSSTTSSNPSTTSSKKPTIKALILDKDNTTCPPKSLDFTPSYLSHLKVLRTQFPKYHSLLFVSNTAGSTPSAKHESEALELERITGIPVLRQGQGDGFVGCGCSKPHETPSSAASISTSPMMEQGSRKPLVHAQIMYYLRTHDITSDPAEVAVIGDRLSTDVLMAHLMGSWSVWLRDGVKGESGKEDYRGILAKMEGWGEAWARARNMKPQRPDEK